MDIMGIIQLLLPVATFAMGFFLTDIQYRREKKMRVIREKFEKLLHPFWMLINELGADRPEGLALDVKNTEVFQPILDHLLQNSYLAPAKGQEMVWTMRAVGLLRATDTDDIDRSTLESLEATFGDFENVEKLYERLTGECFVYYMKLYEKTAKILGYEMLAMAYGETPEELREET